MRWPMVLCVVAASGAAIADPLRRAEPVEVPVRDLPLAADDPPRLLFLNRCANGCTILYGGDDAATITSSLPQPSSQPEFTLSAFAFGDDEWNQVVTCVQQVYSPYDITITDQLPTDGSVFNQTFVAGVPSEIGYAADILGIAPLAGDCRVLSNTSAFAFANQHPATDRVNNICWTVSQESAHIYGLDHEYQFTNGASACNDPMTYRNDCGGQKFFRNDDAQCGEYTTRACKCTATQNSHQGLLDRFGAGTPITPPPTVSIVVPAATQTTYVQGQAVQAQAFAQRGVATITLYLNGYPWVTDPGVPFGPEGQPMTTYALIPPDNVPDGVIDISVQAADDIGAATMTSVITVTKGAPCVDTSKCLTGQLCGSGKCYWETPTAEVGAQCGYPQFCVSGVCDSGVCVQPCDPTQANTCPSSFTCEGAGTTATCVATGGGCCSVGNEAGTPLVLGAFGLGWLLRRRKR